MFGATFRVGNFAGFAERVVADLARDQRRRMGDAAAYVMRSARGRIRRRRGISAPGESPSSHTGLLRNQILFAVEPEGQGALIGPAALADRAAIVPGILEFGGTFPASRGRGRYDPSLTAGDFLARGYGPMEAGAIEPGAGGRRRGGPGGSATNTALGKVLVRRGRIRTMGQAERAARLYHGLKIGAVPAGRAVTIAARPYMNPALEASLPYVAAILAGER